MCDLLRIKTDRGTMIGDDQFGLSISGKPIYHFGVTSIFNGYAIVHFGCVAKINPESPLAKVCVLSCGILAAAPGLNEKGAWGCMGLTMTRLKLIVF
ncbi:alcohol dehydrogenase [Carex littledalei]|uniref:alcohol dehydrogenase n=1 Tax=Carex littledalei TaxID=544730 RepID=A0A833RU42_9POAL|nr:alcohol dehydrogenase [Carex littledalei]